jgi:hypothetical protein
LGLSFEELTIMTQNSILNRRLRIERLERRELLCSAMVGATASHAASQFALFSRGQNSAIVTNSNSTTNGVSDEANETHLFATLTNSSGAVVGTVGYESEVNGSTTTQKLLISVVGAAANASYDVSIGTTSLGTLTTDANGNGRLVLTSAISNTSSSSTSSSTCGGTSTGTLPSDFTLGAGATIALASTDTTVDSLSGTFATSTGDIGLGNGFGGGGGCHGGENSVSRLEATLANGTTTVGRSVFSTYTNSDDTTTDILRVHLKGADLSATLDVSVDGTSLGSITTDANGNGILILSSNPKSTNVGQLPAGFTIASSSTITIGTSITGSFASASSSSAMSAMSGSTATSFRPFTWRRR